MLAGRYQILGMLGRGGMGEVYRANDLTLDQEMALKFLPPNMSSNPSMLARFHGEVRIARQVSHPNVCRVYDIGEVDGQLFLSMEYVDGEDLGGLLRRIGRLPADKAVEFARKLCAGLAAAHEKGVIHRDLKPANIMIDGRGQVVIMDFGLAGVAEQMVGAEINAGTPGYMAPEQLAGREVTVRSDIYALGLVLFEMFTGKRPFDGKTLAEMIRLQEHSLPPSLVSVVKDLDPAVERVIQRCLAPDPRNRPASALAVAAALPGGDPLAAALAAGETPSPDMVAASGSASGLKPWIAFSIAAFVALSLVAIIVMGPMVTVTGLVSPEFPPDVLSHKAREIAARLGYTQKGVGVARAFAYDGDALQYLENNMRPGERWDAVATERAQTMFFWHRESPRYLEPLSRTVQATDPPDTMTGMWRMNLDPKGRMRLFIGAAPQVEDSAAHAGAVDWNVMLTAAGVDPAAAKQTQPKWTPPMMADERMAWTAPMPDFPKTEIQLEAAAWRGRPVYFVAIGPWTRPSRMVAFQPSLTNRIVQAVILSLAVGLLLAACLLTRHNLKRGRGDREGATRLATFAGVIYFVIWILHGWHVPNTYEIGSLFYELAFSLLAAGTIWVGYVALEPFIRRHWPQALVSWARLLQGGFRDPLVGRDLLVGMGVGCFWTLIWAASNLIEKPYGAMPLSNAFLFPLNGGREIVATALLAFSNVLVQLLVSFFVLFLLRVVLRREWLAAIVFMLLFTLLTTSQSTVKTIDGAFAVVISVSIYFVLTRAGLVAFFTALYVQYFFVFIPLTSDFSLWWAGPTIFAILLMSSVTAWGVYSALAGVKVISDDFL